MNSSCDNLKLVGRATSYARVEVIPADYYLMFILYLDESGTHAEASYFVLAGLAVFEREIHWFSQDLDDLQKEYFPESTEPIYFHAARLRVPDNVEVEEPWNQLTAERRRELKNRVYDILRNRRGVLFGTAVEKRFAETRGEDPYEHAFEDIISRFDLFMSRTNRQSIADNKKEQRGLVVLAQSSFQKTLGLLAHRLREHGTR